MKAVLHLISGSALFFCLLVISLSVHAMSPATENTTNITSSKHGKTLHDSNPETDARTAIIKGDLRLLGFALRATVVPGVALTDRQSAMDTCGIRLMKGFGDVVRSDDQANAMQLAHEYAKRYNAVILKQCFKDN